MDKNLSEVFIFWDKLFGTYQEELPNDYLYKYFNFCIQNGNHTGIYQFLIRLLDYVSTDNKNFIQIEVNLTNLIN